MLDAFTLGGTLFWCFALVVTEFKRAHYRKCDPSDTPVLYRWSTKAAFKCAAVVNYLCFAWFIHTWTSAPGSGHMMCYGLACAAIGDVALLSRRRRPFLIGLIAFLSGHVCYTIGLIRLAHNAGASVGQWALGCAVSVVPAAFVWGSWLAHHVEPKMRRPVQAYTAVISIMFMSSFVVWLSDLNGHGSPHRGFYLMCSAAAFFVSDLCVARERFVHSEPWNRAFGLPLYFGAQIGFAWAITL